MRVKMTENTKITFPRVSLFLGLAVLLVFLGISLANYWNLARQTVLFPYPVDYGEGPLLDQVMRLLQGENIYRNTFAEPPYTISNYPPLFLLAQVPFAKVFGPAFWYGRAISILGALLAALFIGLTLYTLTGDWIASVIGGVLLLAYPYTQYWSVLNRIDLLALMFSWAGIFAAVRWHERRWGIPLAAILFIAAVFTRQTYALAGPAGVFAWLLLQRRFRQALTLAALTGGIGLALFLLVNGLTRGGFYLNIVAANVNPFYWQTVNRNMVEILTNSFLLLFIVGIFLIAERTGDHTRTWPLVLPYVIAGTLSAITVGKDGSNVNYMLEMTAALCFGTGAGLAWIGRNAWLRALGVVVMILQVNTFIGWTRADYNGRIDEKITQADDIARLAELVRNTDGMILADEYMGLLPLAGKRIYFQPFEYKMLADGGIWDEKPFLQAIADHKYSMILQYQPYTWPAVVSRWTPAMRAQVRASYGQERTIAYNWVFLPK